MMFLTNRHVLFALVCSFVAPTFAAATSSPVERYELCQKLPYYDQEQQYLIRRQQLDSYKEAMGLIQQGDFITAQRALLSSLEKMKVSCDINHYELSSELDTLAWLLEKKHRYAEAQSLFENALPLVEYDDFIKGFLISAAKYAWFAEKQTDAILLIKRVFSGEGGKKISPDLWHIDEKNNQLSWRVANMRFPVINAKKWLLVDIDSGETRDYPTDLTYILSSGGKIRFTMIYNEVEKEDSRVSPEDKNVAPPVTDIGHIPDFPVDKNLQQKFVVAAEEQISVTWKIKQGDWRVTIKAKIPESDSQAAIKSIADLFAQIKWDNPPKLYHQQTMRSIEAELYPLGVGLSAPDAPDENWDKARIIAQKGLQIAAFPAEYQKFYSITGLADYRKGKYADASQAFEKARAQFPYTHNDWDYEKILFYSALSALRFEEGKDGYELLAKYIQAAGLIGDSQQWSVDTAHGAIRENKDDGLIFPLLTAQTILEYAGTDYLLYSSEKNPDSFLVQILPSDTSPKAFILQRLKMAKDQTEGIKFEHTAQDISGSQNNAVRWVFHKEESIRDYLSPDDGVYWFIPWQGKTIAVFPRTYDRKAPAAEKTDNFVRELLTADLKEKA